MSEFSLRGYNVAIPQIDEGDDVFVVNNTSGAMWRIQVKTARPRSQKKSSSYQFHVKASSISTPLTPDLHFTFLLRHQDRWRFLVIDRAVLHNYVVSQNLGTATKAGYRMFTVVLHNDGRAICSGHNLSHHLENWATWPPL